MKIYNLPVVIYCIKNGAYAMAVVDIVLTQNTEICCYMRRQFSILDDALLTTTTRDNRKVCCPVLHKYAECNDI